MYHDIISSSFSATSRRNVAPKLSVHSHPHETVLQYAISKKNGTWKMVQKVATYPELYRRDVLKSFTQLRRCETLHKACESHAR